MAPPTPPEVQSPVNTLSAARRALLNKLLIEQRARNRRGQGIPRRAHHSPCPLSFSQQLMWLSDQLIPQGSTYNVPIPLRLDGELHVPSLRQTVNRILERHEVFRTTIRTVDGQPLQFISEPEHWDLPVVDVPGESAAEREAKMMRLCHDAARQPFDLSKDRLLRATLFRLDPGSHVLLLITHHIAFDGASRKVLLHELEAIYTALREGKPTPLAELAIQYADYAVWQRERMEGGMMEKHLAYWKDHLAGAPLILELPADRPRPAIQTFRGARQVSSALQPLREPLKQLRCAEETTLYMIALAAFSILLHRYTGQESIVIGTPVLGRERAELNGLIGYISNTLVLRIDLSGDPTFREFLRRVRDVVLGAFDHQEMPLERLVMELQPARDASRSPVFQVLFSAGNTRVVMPRLPGLTVSSFKIDRGITKLDLTIALTETENELLDVCEYSTDLFDDDTIARVLDHFHTLVESLVADPDQRLSELRMLKESEERRLLIDWNNTRSPYLSDACVHQLFESEALRTPKAPAAEFQGIAINYSELNARANQLADYLRSRGARPGKIVALCIERSLDVAVGTLGILKTGSACLPLDPAYPPERLNFMLKDSGAAFVLAHGSTSQCAASSQSEVILLDSDIPLASAVDARELARGVTPDDVAFVLYTSGSTGEPKGVLLTHRGLVNHNIATARYYGMHPADRVLQFASLSFDIALEEMFPAWSSGGTVVFRPDDLLMTGRPLLDWIAAQRITVLDLPTAFWNQWAHELAATGAKTPLDLRLLIVGGDKARGSALNAWRMVAGDRVRWINTYGPTEASIIAAAYEPPASVAEALSDPPIGRPIANVQIYILDGHRRPAPIGVAGEIYIGGDGLARGYLNRSELTADRFIPNPFSFGGGSRLYRTGDKARYLADGNMEFLGRMDEQVKIRGFRVEPREIRTVLNSHSAVRESFVLARAHTEWEKQLVAYVVLHEPSAASASDLRNFLKMKLPDYMVPMAFVTVGELPLTANGKVDRDALPAPDPVSPGEFCVPPQTPSQLVIAEAWKEALRIDRVGRFDNFFDLGGYSLAAVRVVARLEEKLGVRINPRQMLFQTLGQLASVYDERVRLQRARPLPPPRRLFRNIKKAVMQFASSAR